MRKTAFLAVAALLVLAIVAGGFRTHATGSAGWSWGDGDTLAA